MNKQLIKATVLYGILSKSTRQNFIFSLFINLFYKLFVFFLLIFYLFFTMTITPNPRLVSGY